jgi:bifunctional NMN adenylyltransferase/nudix hydrolase
MKTPTYGAIVGRFQVDSLTHGHRKLIDRVIELHDHVIIVIGCSRTPVNATNPLSFECRKAMIERTYAGTPLIFVRQSDERFDDVWSQKLDAALDNVSNGDVTLYTGRDGFSPHYKGRLRVVELNLGCDFINATEIRQRIVDTPTFDSKDFRAGMIYAMNTKHFQTYTTVDMALLYNTGEKVQILLCRKPNELTWRFPGGFVEEAQNETFAQAAAREMQEETGAMSENGWKIVGDYPLPNEWRLRNNKGVSHRTILLYGFAMSRYAKADDDIADVQWFDLDYVIEHADEIITNEHRIMMVNDVFKSLTEKVTV